MDIPAYPSRPFYTLDFNDYKIEDRVLGRFEEDEPPRTAIQQEIQKEKDKIRRGMPLEVTLSRDINDDIEKLKLEEVLDKDGNTLNKNFFNLQVQSMSEVENFWLDSSIYSLNIII